MVCANAKNDAILPDKYEITLVEIITFWYFFLITILLKKVVYCIYFCCKWIFLLIFLGIKFVFNCIIY